MDKYISFRKAEIDITPSVPCLMSGHVARSHKESDSILDPIFAKAIILSSEKETTLFISLELIEIADDYLRVFRKRLSEVSGIEEKNIQIACIHTHTAPSVIYIGTIPLNKPYMDFVVEKTAVGIKDAMEKQAIPVRVFSAVSEAGFGVNRRFKDPVTGSFSMKPNPTGPYDRSVPVVAFRDLEDKTVAVIYNCSVHPTAIGVNLYGISADYPGRINKYLKRAYGDICMPMAITGSCGDVRPAIVAKDGKTFTDGTVADIERIGAETAASIVKALEKGKEAKDGVETSMYTEYVPLEMKPAPSKEELKKMIELQNDRIAKAEEEAAKLSEFERAHEDPVWTLKADKEWMERMLNRKDDSHYIDAQLSLWVINKSIAIFCVPGELFTEVGIKIKKLWKKDCALLAGYCNGSMGYMPSASAVNEGGYEVKEAFKHLAGHTGSFTEQLETALLSEMQKFIDKDSK